jgi:hypothetical protein
VVYSGRFDEALDEAVGQLRLEGIEPAWGDLYCVIGFDEAKEAGLTHPAIVAAYFRLSDIGKAGAFANHLGLFRFRRARVSRLR